MLIKKKTLSVVSDFNILQTVYMTLIEYIANSDVCEHSLHFTFILFLIKY